MTTQALHLTASQTLPEEEGSLKKRHQWSCEKCRKDKQKCLPVDRDWNNREKCVRCTRLNNDCGPPINITSNKKRKRKKNIHSARDSPEAVIALKELTDREQQRLEAMSQRSTFEPQPLVVDVGMNVKMQSPAKVNEVKARSLLAHLEDILVVQCQLLNLAQYMALAFNIRGMDETLRQKQAAMVQAMTCINMMFGSARQEFARCRKETNLQARGELIQRFENLSFKFQQSETRIVSPYGNIEDDMYDILWKYGHDRRLAENDGGRYSKAYHIQQGALSQSDSDRDVAVIFEAAARLSKIFNTIAINMSDWARAELFDRPMGWKPDLNDSATCFKLPATHLAVQYASPEIIRKVITQSGKYCREQGLLGFTTLHLSAYAGCMMKLQPTFEHNSSTPIASCGPDVFSLTPHLIAAYLNHRPAFELLYNHHADMTLYDGNGKSARVHGAEQNSKEVIAFVLEKGIFMPSAHDDLLAAINAGHEKMAKRFAKYYMNDPLSRDDWAHYITIAAQAAAQRGWQDVVDILTGKPQRSAALPASEALNATIHSVEGLSWDEYLDSGPNSQNLSHQTTGCGSIPSLACSLAHLFSHNTPAENIRMSYGMGHGFPMRTLRKTFDPLRITARCHGYHQQNLSNFSDLYYLSCHEHLSITPFLQRPPSGTSPSAKRADRRAGRIWRSKAFMDCVILLSHGQT